MKDIIFFSLAIIIEIFCILALNLIGKEYKLKNWEDKAVRKYGFEDLRTRAIFRICWILRKFT